VWLHRIGERWRRQRDDEIAIRLECMCENMLTGRDKNGKKDLADMVNWALISNLEFSFACPQVENQRDVKSNSISFSNSSQILYSIEVRFEKVSTCLNRSTPAHLRLSHVIGAMTIRR